MSDVGAFPAKMYAKTKELGPVWGKGWRVTPPESSNVIVIRGYSEDTEFCVNLTLAHAVRHVDTRTDLLIAMALLSGGGGGIPC